MSPNTANRNPKTHACDDIAELIRPLNKLAKMRRRQFGSLAGAVLLSAIHAAERASLTSADGSAEQADV